MGQLLAACWVVSILSESRRVFGGRALRRAATAAAGFQSSLSRGGSSEENVQKLPAAPRVAVSILSESRRVFGDGGGGGVRRRHDRLVSILSESRRVFGEAAVTARLRRARTFQSSLSRGGSSEAAEARRRASWASFNPL